jgi:Right handed beta helix region
MGSFSGLVVSGQSSDLGEQIVAEDARLGVSPGEIYVSASGTISEGKVSLSAGHNLVCDSQVTISLSAGSYLYQDSNTSIKNCIISSTSTPIAGEIQSINTHQVVLEGITFIGGGNLVYWSGVTGFRISDNKVGSISALNQDTDSPQAGYYLLNSSWGVIDNLTSNGFTFPGGINYTAILELNRSSHIAIKDPTVRDVDASNVLQGGAVVEINGSTDITLRGGNITHNANMDGVLSEGYPVEAYAPYPKTPSSYIIIDGVNSSYNGAVGINQNAPLALGDGLDIINTSHVRVSHCVLNGNGNPIDLQPGIWLFLDDDVEVTDSDISENSASGISAAGTPNVRLRGDTINRNQASGVYTEWQGGTATNVGPAVRFASGPTGSFGVDWRRGTPFILNGVTYQISSVTDSEHLTLTSAAPDHPSPVPFGVNTTQDIVDTVINDNGVGEWSGQFGEQYQVGISWADGTNGTIAGVTSTNTGIGNQLYGLELANSASVTLNNDNFFGNLMGGDGIDASFQGMSSTILSFPDQQVATTSSPQTINFWSGMIVASSLFIQTTGSFSQGNNCGTRLPAYATCQIQIVFTPTVPGTQHGSLIITDWAPDSPQMVSLSGTGVAASQGVSASELSFPNQRVGTISSAQAVTFWAGSSGVKNLTIQVSGNFSQTNNCGSSLPAFAACQIQIIFAPSITGTLHGILSISDTAPNPPSILLAGTALPGGIGLRIASGTSNSATVVPGATATYMLSIGGTGIGGPVSLSCTGAPSGATCNLPSAMMVDANRSTTFAVDVTTLALTMSTFHNFGFWQPGLLAFAFVGLIVLSKAPKGTQRTRRLSVNLFVSVLLLCSCGAGAPPGTRPGSYTVVITAKMGTVSQQMQLLLRVE